MGLADVEIPVFVDPHCGSVRVPAGVGKQEVLKPGQHLREKTENDCGVEFSGLYGIHVSAEMTGTMSVR